MWPCTLVSSARNTASLLDICSGIICCTYVNAGIQKPLRLLARLCCGMEEVQSQRKYAYKCVHILADDSNATTATLPGMDFVDDEVASHSGANHFDDGDPEVQFLQVRSPSEPFPIMY